MKDLNNKDPQGSFKNIISNINDLIDPGLWEEVGQEKVKNPDPSIRYCQRCILGSDEVAQILEAGTGPDTTDSKISEMYAGETVGAHGSIGLYVYTFEDEDYVYVAHYIYEVEHQAYLWRHNK